MANIITFHKIRTKKMLLVEWTTVSIVTMWQMTHIRVTKVKAAGHTCQLSPIWNKMNIQNLHTRRRQNGQWRHIRIRRRAAGEHPHSALKFREIPCQFSSIWNDINQCHHGVIPANRKKVQWKLVKKYLSKSTGYLMNAKV